MAVSFPLDIEVRRETWDADVVLQHAEGLLLEQPVGGLQQLRPRNEPGNDRHHEPPFLTTVHVPQPAPDVTAVHGPNAGSRALTTSAGGR